MRPDPPPHQPPLTLGCRPQLSVEYTPPPETGRGAAGAQVGNEAAAAPPARKRKPAAAVTVAAVKVGTGARKSKSTRPSRTKKKPTRDRGADWDENDDDEVVEQEEEEEEDKHETFEWSCPYAGCSFAAVAITHSKLRNKMSKHLNPSHDISLKEFDSRDVAQGDMPPPKRRRKPSRMSGGGGSDRTPASERSRPPGTASSDSKRRVLTAEEKAAEKVLADKAESELTAAYHRRRDTHRADLSKLIMLIKAGGKEPPVATSSDALPALEAGIPPADVGDGEPASVGPVPKAEAAGAGPAKPSEAADAPDPVDDAVAPAPAPADDAVAPELAPVDDAVAPAPATDAATEAPPAEVAVPAVLPVAAAAVEPAALPPPVPAGEATAVVTADAAREAVVLDDGAGAASIAHAFEGFADVDDCDATPGRRLRRARIDKHTTMLLSNELADGDPDPFTILACQPFTMGRSEQPFGLSVMTNALFLMDLHCHLSKTEVIGFLAGKWDPATKQLVVREAFPCRALELDDDKDVRDRSVEMDPESEVQAKELIAAKGYDVVGWYHSHPVFKAEPSLRDIESQEQYQRLFQDDDGHEPFVGIIIAPYDRGNTTVKTGPNR